MFGCWVFRFFISLCLEFLMSGIYNWCSVFLSSDLFTVLLYLCQQCRVVIGKDSIILKFATRNIVSAICKFVYFSGNHCCPKILLLTACRLSTTVSWKWCVLCVYRCLTEIRTVTSPSRSCITRWKSWEWISHWRNSTARWGRQILIRMVVLIMLVSDSS